jgi:hypothetical protein
MSPPVRPNQRRPRPASRAPEPVEDARRIDGAPRAAAALLHRSAEPSATDVLDLQRAAGNNAVTAALQRAPAVRRPGDPEEIPEHGPEVRPELQARLPGLLGALTDAQLDQWQRVVDYYTIAPKVRRAKDAVEKEYELQGQFRFDDPGYRKKMRKLDAAMPKTTAADEKLSVDVRRLFAENVMEPPEFDVDAELVFRQWAVEQLAKNPVQLNVRPTASWYEALGQWPMTIKNTKGFVTAENLRQEFPNEYYHWVSHRPLIAKLEQALTESQQVFNEVVPQH